jgi:glycosyltransferase involved in cell wall biosynthesis
MEVFFELAARTPNVKFVAVGRAHDRNYDRRLRARFGHIRNLSMPGFISRFDKDGLQSLYERAWILVNTSAREGLPYTFLEAGAWECAVLSFLNPGDFTRSFGAHAHEDGLAGGLKWLLARKRWRELGRRAAGYVARTFGTDNSVAQHLTRYGALMDRSNAWRERRYRVSA